MSADIDPNSLAGKLARSIAILRSTDEAVRVDGDGGSFVAVRHADETWSVYARSVGTTLLRSGLTRDAATMLATREAESACRCGEDCAEDPHGDDMGGERAGDLL